MILQNKELKFLDFYTNCISTENELYDKLFIETNKDEGKIKFYQISKDIYLITELEKQIEEDINLILPTQQFVSLISSNPEETFILNNEGIKFKSGEYTFNKYDISNSEIKYFENIIKNNKLEFFSINNFELLSIAMKSCGDDKFKIVTLQEGYLLSSNKSSKTSILKTENSIIEKIYFSEKILNLLSKYSNNNFSIQLSIDKKENIYIYKLNDSFIIVPLIDNSPIPNLLLDTFKNQYYHSYKLVINKEDFDKAIKRIKILGKTSLNNRIYLSFHENLITLECKENTVGYAKEEFVANVPTEVIGNNIVISLNFLVDTVIPGIDKKDKSMYLRISSLEEYSSLRAICFHNEDESRIFVTTLQKKYEVNNNTNEDNE
jgi:hypothetical protein